MAGMSENIVNVIKKDKKSVDELIDAVIAAGKKELTSKQKKDLIRKVKGNPQFYETKLYKKEWFKDQASNVRSNRGDYSGDDIMFQGINTTPTAGEVGKFAGKVGSRGAALGALGYGVNAPLSNVEFENLDKSIRSRKEPAQPTGVVAEASPEEMEDVGQFLATPVEDKAKVKEEPQAPEEDKLAVGASFVDENYLQSPAPVSVSMEPMPASKNLPVAPDLSQEIMDMEVERALYQDAVKEAALAYKLEKDDLRKKELWSGLVQAMGMLAAGAYGIKNNLDMSGVKFNSTDWIARAKEARDDLQTALANSEKDYGIAKSIIDARKEGKLQNWQINSKIIENANKEAHDRYRDKLAGSQVSLDVQKTNEMFKDRYNEALINQKRAEQDLSRARKGEEAAAAKIALEKNKAIASKVKDFNTKLGLYSKAKNDNKNFLLEELKNINAEVADLTGQPMVPESAFTDEGFFYDSAASAESIAAAKRNVPEASGQGYSPEQENAIRQVMQQYGISRERAIQEMQAQGYL